MCKISANTIVRANSRTKVPRIAVDVQSLDKDNVKGIVASTVFNGKLYQQKIPVVKMKQAYARALGTVIGNGGYGK